MRDLTKPRLTEEATTAYPFSQSANRIASPRASAKIPTREFGKPSERQCKIYNRWHRLHGRRRH